MLNYTVLFFVSIFSFYDKFHTSKINPEQDEYLNLIYYSKTKDLLHVIDGFNTLLIFVSLFYYTSKSSRKLEEIATFFIQISGVLLNLAFLFFFVTLVFALAFFFHFEQRIAPFNQLTSVIVSVYSLAVGNVLLNENDKLIEDAGEPFYYFVSRFFYSSYFWQNL